MELVSASAEHKGLSLKIDVPESLFVFVDKDILESIIRNLLTNAVKFTDKGGHIVLNAVLQQDIRVKICAKDSGIGMAKAEIKNFFDIGMKSGKPGTAGEKGAGLGMILCKDFVEISDGKLWMNSKP